MLVNLSDLLNKTGTNIGHTGMTVKNTTAGLMDLSAISMAEGSSTMNPPTLMNLINDLKNTTGTSIGKVGQTVNAGRKIGKTGQTVKNTTGTTASLQELLGIAGGMTVKNTTGSAGTLQELLGLKEGMTVKNTTGSAGTL